MGKPLFGKEMILAYIENMKDKALDDSIKLGNFPHFFIGNRMCSHTDIIDKWFIDAAMKKVKIGTDPCGDEKCGKGK